MLLTFAEIQFLVSLGDAGLDGLEGPDGSEPDALGLLDLLDEPARALDDIAAAGLASLVAGGWCAVTLDDEGFVRHVELSPRVAVISDAINAATASVRVTTVSPERSTFWLLLNGPARAAVTPVGAGVFAVVMTNHDLDLRQQVMALVNSALVDDPFAGVAISRSGRLDAMTFRTNAELGGPDASPDERRASITELVDEIFVKQHPSHPGRAGRRGVPGQQGPV